jgi:hypothetical protein
LPHGRVVVCIGDALGTTVDRYSGLGTLLVIVVIVLIVRGR